MKKPKWEHPSYQKIKNAEFSNGNIIVSFQNGDKATIKMDLILKSVDLLFTDHEIIIPVINIPWDHLRVITDLEFGKHLANESVKQSKLIGKKIKKLREERGINSKELAERADVTPQTITRIENGQTDVGFSTLRKILTAMGCSLKDLSSL